ncbi:hypothetical protein [Laspinema palackyanum]
MDNEWETASGCRILCHPSLGWFLSLAIANPLLQPKNWVVLNL